MAGTRGSGRGCASGRLVLWLNEARHELALAPGRATDGVHLLDVLAAHGIAHELRARAWRDASLGAEPLLVRVGPLAGSLEVVVNGHLAPIGVAHLRVRPGDEVVIGELAYLRRRFEFFRPHASPPSPANAEGEAVGGESASPAVRPSILGAEDA